VLQFQYNFSFFQTTAVQFWVLSGHCWDVTGEKMASYEWWRWYE